MSIQRRIPMAHEDVFPLGAYLVDEFSAVPDFNAEVRSDGSRPQQVDPDSGLPVWTVNVIDPDPEAGKREKTVSVKFAAKHQPVPPANKSGTPFTLVEFVGLTATPWIDDSSGRPRLQWSLRASDLTEVGASRRTSASQSTKDLA